MWSLLLMFHAICTLVSWGKLWSTIGLFLIILFHHQTTNQVRISPNMNRPMDLHWSPNEGGCTSFGVHSEWGTSFGDFGCSLEFGNRYEANPFEELMSEIQTTNKSHESAIDSKVCENSARTPGTTKDIQRLAVWQNMAMEYHSVDDWLTTNVQIPLPFWVPEGRFKRHLDLRSVHLCADASFLDFFIIPVISMWDDSVSETITQTGFDL